ncbi:MAG: iron-containing alcohol dehydrogenase [Candidatus Pelagadaptatus aseana]|uniref:iron-containing alcohol dehydrogenase n=1 Tax=Candidatus Pelagadaptatus aseana TaxID=3120508 RepID=UPI0039B25E9C
MSLLYKLKGRIVSSLLKFLPIQLPVVFKGAGSTVQLCGQIDSLGYSKVLIVTDEVLHKLGALDVVKAELDKSGIAYAIYDKVQPNPLFSQVLEALALFQQEQCQAVVSIGGGSVIDAAKMVAMMHTNPGDKLKKYDGIQKFKKAGVTQFVVPSTAGTGSEVSVGAVITDDTTHAKFVIIDTKMAPQYVALDSEIMKGMPPGITAATGMDALTHAVESYLATGGGEASDLQAKTATKLIFKYLKRAYQNGEDMEARDNMALAAFYAGVAMSRTSLGYVHGVAHQLSRLCETPHGLANAMVLPEVLSAYGNSVHKKLADLAREAGIGNADDNDSQLANDFIQAIKDLRSDMAMPLKPKGFKPEYVQDVTDAAISETGNLYPVPRYMSKAEISVVVQGLV